MASVFLTSHNENVYNLIKNPAAPPPKPPRHVSAFKNKVRQDMIRNKSPCRTMGYSNVPLHPPEEFLKKGTRFQLKRTSSPRPEHPVKPPVPDRKSQFKHVSKEAQDFVTKNALNVIRKPALRPLPTFVDTCKGDQHLLEPSGMARKYVYKKNYGSVPAYLSKFHEEKMQKLGEAKRSQEEAMQRVRKKFHQVSQEEQESIIEGLKRNWHNLYREFLGMSVLIDNLHKKMFKEQLEKQMLQLEKDIQLLERHKPVFVVPAKEGEHLTHSMSRIMPLAKDAHKIQ